MFDGGWWLDWQQQLTHDYEPKLADFGQTRRCFGVANCMVGHEAYRAPELCAVVTRNYNRCAHWNEKADVYSLGILLWELLHKQIPFSDHPRDEVCKLVRRGERPSFRHRGTGSSPAVNKQWKRLIRRCWASDPLERPTAEAVAEALATMPGPFDRRNEHKQPHPPQPAQDDHRHDSSDDADDEGGDDDENNEEEEDEEDEDIQMPPPKRARAQSPQAQARASKVKDVKSDESDEEETRHEKSHRRLKLKHAHEHEHRHKHKHKSKHHRHHHRDEDDRQ